MSLFVDFLRHCLCCPRQCGVDRLAGELGFCRVGELAYISHAGLHFGEEPPISGARGSGTIFFAGCNLRCLFCQNYQISQEFDPVSTNRMTSSELAAVMLRLQESGAHNINFVSPSHVLWQMAEAIVIARACGLTIPIVYNSNGYDSVESLRRIRGLVDIYLPDLKYQDKALARDYSKAADYSENVGGVLIEMLDQVGHLEVDGDGVARRGLLVRHLVLPGGVDNSKACLRLLAGLDPAVSVSIMSQYSPQYQARQHPNLNRPLTAAEYDEVTDYALDLGLENAFVQELESQEVYLPDFDRDEPFAG